MAIQNRRGDYNDFDSTALVEGEFAAVLQNDPIAQDGKAVYVGFGNGTAKRMATYNEISALVDSAEESAESAEASAATAGVSAETATTKATEASESAISASDSASIATTKASEANQSALNAEQSAASVAGVVEQASEQAELSESWAVGGTGVRTGEDTNNAYYWSLQAQAAAGGGVTSVNGQTGAVDLDAEDVGALSSTGGVAHNSIYRGKYLGTSVTAEQYAAISAGTFEDLYIGDYWTIGGINYRIAAFDYYINCGDTQLTAHHAVIVPEKNLYNAAMNDTNTTTGGYVGSQMYTTNLEQAKTTIKAAFSGHVVNHRIYLVNAVANGYSSGYVWVDSEVNLMNEQMVYGSGIFSPVSTGSAVPANYRVEKNQLPLFAMNPAMLNTRGNYWLRDVISASYFARVNYGGFATCYGASDSSYGVRPAFCIS